MVAIGGFLFLERKTYPYLMKWSTISRYVWYPSCERTLILLILPRTKPKSMWNISPGLVVSLLEPPRLDVFVIVISSQTLHFYIGCLCNLGTLSTQWWMYFMVTSPGCSSCWCQSSCSIAFWSLLMVGIGFSCATYLWRLDFCNVLRYGCWMYHRSFLPFISNEIFR